MESLGHSFEPSHNLSRDLSAISPEQIALESLVDALFAKHDAGLFELFNKMCKEDNNGNI